MIEGFAMCQIEDTVREASSLRARGGPASWSVSWMVLWQSRLIKYAFQFWGGRLKNLNINRWEIPSCSHDLYLSCWYTGPYARRHYHTFRCHSPEDLDRACWAPLGLVWEGAEPQWLPWWVHGLFGLCLLSWLDSSISVKSILFLVLNKVGSWSCCYLLQALWAWVDNKTTLTLSFLICSLGIRTLPILQGHGKESMNSCLLKCKILWTPVPQTCRNLLPSYYPSPQGQLILPFQPP